MPIKTYSEQYKRSPNQNKWTRIKPKFIVLHHSYGSFAGGVSWITNKQSRVSYHYMIDKDGSRVQFVYDTRRAWHAGQSTWKGYNGLNSHSVGIAFYGDTNSRKTTYDEIDSAAEKCIYLMNKFSIGIDSIITHKMIAPERKNDCSDDVYNRVIIRVKERLRIS